MYKARFVYQLLSWEEKTTLLLKRVFRYNKKNKNKFYCLPLAFSFFSSCSRCCWIWQMTDNRGDWHMLQHLIKIFTGDQNTKNKTQNAMCKTCHATYLTDRGLPGMSYKKLCNSLKHIYHFPLHIVQICLCCNSQCLWQN